MFKDLIARILKWLTEGAFQATHSTELEAANARIKELEGQITDLKDAKAATMQAYNDLAAREAAARNDLQVLQVDNRRLQAENSALAAKAKGIEDDAKAVADKPIDDVFS